MSIFKTVGLASAVAIGLGVGGLPTTSYADTYVITSDHSSDQGVTAGLTDTGGVTINVTQFNATSLYVSLTFASGWGLIVNGQDPASLVFALSSSLGTATITGLSSGSAVTPDNTIPGIQLNGGIFTGGLNGTGYGVMGGTPSSPLTTLSFYVNATGITLTSLLQGSYTCTAHLTCTTQEPIYGFFFADVSSPGGTGVLDFGPSESVSQVPIPPAALLFGTALVGMGILGRRRRKDGLKQAA